MIHRLFSPTLKSFKALSFVPGLNILIANKSTEPPEKETEASDRRTRNRAGKTSMVELIHFLLGAEARPKSLVRQPALVEHVFGLEFTIRGEHITVLRSGKKPSEIIVEHGHGIPRKLSNSEWKEFLGEKMFGLPSTDSAPTRGQPSFRNLFGYFARRQRDGGFIEPTRHNEEQQLGDQQVALSWLMGLDWQVPAELDELRARERTLRELKAAVGKGALGEIIGSAAELKTQLTIAESKLSRLRNVISQFRVHEQYRAIETEVAELSKQLQRRSNENWADERLVKEIEENLHTEVAPTPTSLERFYKEVQITLPEVVKRRFDEVHAFHESVLRNRRSYLESELASTQQRITERRKQVDKLDERRSELMAILKSTGALEQFTELQGEFSRQEARVEALRRQYSSAEQLEGKKIAFELERNKIHALLQRDYLEQDEVLRRAILTFQDASSALLEDAGVLNIEPTKNGPMFHIHVHGGRSAGIGSMKMFCFDMMLMSLCAARGIGPDFIIHDSHLFDPVDERQVSHALWYGAQKANELGFQYIVTLNSDRLPRSEHPPFDPVDHLLKVQLTDSHETGGLFGFRFA